MWIKRINLLEKVLFLQIKKTKLFALQLSESNRMKIKYDI